VSCARRERGAAAVEFALVVLPLLMILFGIIEFGRIYLIQLSLTNAARDAARTVAISDNPDDLTASLTNAPGIRYGSGATVTLDPSTGCESDATVRVSVTITQDESILGIVDGVEGDAVIPVTLTGKATTVCGG
jgi:Flp pilus assembly protein TadG